MLERIQIDPAQIERMRNMPDTSKSSTISDLERYDLGGVNCETCNNTGHITFARDGMVFSRSCKCMNARFSMRRLRQSGMIDMLNRYSMDEYTTPDDLRRRIKAKAMEFVESDFGWFYISGTPGSGKTHLCTAMCGELINKGHDVKYLLWRDFITELKSMMNEESYNEMMKKLISVQILYVDDFFKGKVSDTDKDIAFQLLNGRYNTKSKRTIISSERSLQEVSGMDDAVGSRIYERARGYIIQAPKENWRMK